MIITIILFILHMLQYVLWHFKCLSRIDSDWLSMFLSFIFWVGNSSESDTKNIVNSNKLVIVFVVNRPLELH